MRSPLRRRGFTLIEILVSVAIIGILAALAVPAWAAAAAKARQTEAKAGLKAIHALETAYFAENGEYGTLVAIGFVNEGSARYGYMISDDDGGVVPPDKEVLDTGGGLGSFGGIFPEPGPSTLSDDDDDGTGFCTICDGQAPGDGGHAFGNPHLSTDSFEVVALGSISGAPSPNDIDVWTVDQTGYIENINPGY
jgi:prepilin-type N-terminal cleavage/methylation domain-containing protein